MKSFGAIALVAAATATFESLPASSLEVVDSWPYRCSAGTNVSDFNFYNLEGKVVVITGSDGRLGFPLSLAVAKAGATLVAASRSPAKAATNQQRLEEHLGHRGSVDTMVLDLSSFASVHSAVADLKHQVVDVVVHMAGTDGLDNVTADGFDGTVQINHLSSALLTELLLPALRKSTSPRVVYVGSANMYNNVEDWKLGESVVEQTKAWIRGAPPATQVNNIVMFYYGLSKLLIGNYAVEQAKRHPELTVFTVNPGFGRSDADNKTKYADACNTALQFRPCPQFPEQAVMSTFFAAAQTGIEAASGSLIDFETWDVPESYEIVQSGDTCVTRPLPRREINPHRAAWYDAVQAMIGRPSFLV